MSLELNIDLAHYMIGQTKASILMSDAYKWAMAQAGFPLREETFVLAFRKGGPFYIPINLEKVVQHLLPDPATGKEAAFLTANGYGMTGSMEEAIRGKVRVTAAPKGSWVLAGEPILTVTGPSFLVSWLEPFLLMLHYPIQVATAIFNGERSFLAVCPDEVEILRVIEKAMSWKLHEGILIDTDSSSYRIRVRENIRAVVEALQNEPHRAFEVGLRAAICMQQHMMVLEECRSLGVLKTSNVWGAWKLYMIPVGTTGHEHQERWGIQDENGFRAIRDMRPEPPSYLFDTNDPIRLGIPAALRVIEESPDRPCSLRFDSGDQDEQFKIIRRGCSRNTESALCELGLIPEPPPLHLTPNLIFEDGYTAKKTFNNEEFCNAWNWPRERRMYGYGGYFVSEPHPSPYNRDAVSAAYKLSWSNGPKMKFSGTPGKVSLPGRPCIYRRVARTLGVDSLIAQEGEILEGYLPLTETTLDDVVQIPKTSGMSPKTIRIIGVLTANRDALIAESRA